MLCLLGCNAAIEERNCAESNVPGHERVTIKVMGFRALPEFHCGKLFIVGVAKVVQFIVALKKSEHCSLFIIITKTGHQAGCLVKTFCQPSIDVNFLQRNFGFHKV